MAPRSPFLAFLRVDDLMYLLIKQFSPAEITNQAASSTLIDWPTHHSTLLSLQLVCRTSRDALRVYFYNRRFCERRIVSHILTGCDEVFTLHCSSDYCEQSPLVLPVSALDPCRIRLIADTRVVCYTSWIFSSLAQLVERKHSRGRSFSAVPRSLVYNHSSRPSTRSHRQIISERSLALHPKGMGQPHE